MTAVLLVLLLSAIVALFTGLQMPFLSARTWRKLRITGLGRSGNACIVARI
jgi:hypothetical protein